MAVVVLPLILFGLDDAGSNEFVDLRSDDRVPQITVFIKYSVEMAQEKR